MPHSFGPWPVRSLIVSGIFLLSACNPNSDRYLPAVTVYKSPTCGCCTSWIAHLEENGFTVKVSTIQDVAPLKDQHGVDMDLRSCHTALVGGYVVEGHVPADDVKRMLAERPDIIGIAAPGMPLGSPGMEGDRKDPYDVMAFAKDGTRYTFASR